MEFVIVTLSKDDVCRILYQESQGALESAIGKRDIHGRLLAKGQLAESHAQELIPAGEAAKMFLTAEAIDASIENLWMNQTHQLGEDRSTGIHPPMVNQTTLGGLRIVPSSNRSHPSDSLTCSYSRGFEKVSPI